MKKNYIAPSIEVANIEMQQMFAGSDGFKSNQGGLDGFGGVDTNGSKDPSSRRRGSIWDDDEEDDF